jgi:hypothetical protein
MPVEIFRKVEGPKILKVLGEARRELCGLPIPLALAGEDRRLRPD